MLEKFRLKAYSIVFLSIMLVGCSPGVTVVHNYQQEQTESPSKVLAQWVGNWQTKVVVKPTKQNPKKSVFTGKIQCQWILNKKFVEEVSVGKNAKIHHRYLLGYDPKKKVYRSWFFASDGTFLESTGTWNAQTKTMTWKTDLRDGTTSNEMHRFIDSDTYEWTSIARDKAGKIILNLYGKHRRIK